MRLIALAAVAAAAFSAPAFAGTPASAKMDHHGHAAMTQTDIVDTAVAAGQFGTLVAAVQAAGLVDTLKGEGPFTVFAPLDSAFAALPAGEVERLLLPENQAELASLLTYHVVPGRVTSDQLAGQTLSVETVQGSMLAIDATDGVRVGNANVVQADILTSNGVIHVVDQVIIPAG
ncbi:fasciclin domain-containing protein [Maricaulis salignorans]|uniref:Uncaracterized surface protein containing fasciclin (FAS1) repeats n=1 Tax=Maricaulis salignorans TaxID=144026 RepID=A0A1G9SF62_9PROT|nr:fasciclin domain-containing protein [Maricaulis salignorans]SDM34124.1 Uncaracterized surface protein containing fasciclin (FAS1) repeats [Maricaulis salignorans]